VILGNRKFGNAGECKTFFREVLRRYKNGDTVAETDAEFLKDLLEKHHPKAADKKGAGIKAFKIGHNPQFPDRSPCFQILRLDDTVEHFSYLKCVTAAFADRAAEPRTPIGPSATPAKVQPKAKAQPKPAPAPAPLSRKFTPDTVVKCAGLPASEDKERYKQLKEHFKKFGKVIFVDTDAGAEGEAFLRFKDAEGAKAALRAADHQFDGAKLTLTAVAGDDEKKYYEAFWAQADEKESQRRAAPAEGKGGKGRGKRGQLGDMRDNKRQKTE